MLYVVKLTFKTDQSATRFIQKSKVTPSNGISERHLYYRFITTQAAFEFLCLATSLVAFIDDTACYIIDNTQTDFQ